ncbi:MAG: hypothetical protein WCJ64_18390 [Rhodospirillaceae bacterium]
MSTSSIASSASVTAHQPIQQPARGRVDNDGDEATETAAAKAKESAKQTPAQPANPNLGKHLSVSA